MDGIARIKALLEMCERGINVTPFDGDDLEIQRQQLPYFFRGKTSAKFLRDRP
ncbi:MAG TPA: hypothetical protein VM286_00760 [Candidatus Thermoplasmatota archaeon]|nr:hypothetical protein [Candidatus Thermoplasmatota archaeon]